MRIGKIFGVTLAAVTWIVFLVLSLAMIGCSDDEPYGPLPREEAPATVYAAAGDIGARVEEFRNALGPTNGNAAGEQPAGRREISWDGAGANPFNNRDDFPADFFNTTVTVGAVYTTPGTGLRNDSTLFAEVNPDYASQFRFFSPSKVFGPVGSNVLEQLFQVAGEPTPALVRGFGIVFSDVDVADRTTIELFDVGGASLGTFAAPVRTDAAGLSFVGVTFTSPIIARARITLGTGALGATVDDISSGGTVDVVVLDNVIYGEPTQAY